MDLRLTGSVPQRNRLRRFVREDWCRGQNRTGDTVIFSPLARFA